MVSKAEILEWLENNKEQGYTHMLVVCDTFDGTDYPIFVQKGTDIRKVITDYSKDMQMVDEVYSFHIDFGKQLAEGRAWYVDVLKTQAEIEAELDRLQKFHSSSPNMNYEISGAKIALEWVLRGKYKECSAGVR